MIFAISKLLASAPSVVVMEENWEYWIIILGNEKSVIHGVLQAHKDGFSPSLKNLGSPKGHEI